MPFKKTGDDSYTSPSGRHYNGAQVRLFYANGGKFPGQKGKGEAMNGYAKGGDVRQASYATGGPVLGRTRDFMKEVDPFRDEDSDDTPAGRRKFRAAKLQDYGKSGAGAGNPNPKARPNKRIK